MSNTNVAKIASAINVKRIVDDTGEVLECSCYVCKGIDRRRYVL